LELRAKLRLSEMRQLDQRVSVRCDLDPLSSDGVAGYITHRLQIAGGGVDRVEFSADAIHLISEASRGVPRVINLICDRSLHRGYLGRVWRIDREHVEQALGDLRIAVPALADAEAPPLGGVRRDDREEINLDKLFEAVAPIQSQVVVE